MNRSAISKAAWRRRKREGGKGICFFCKRPIFAGGVISSGHKYHKACLGMARAGLTKRQARVNPRARRAWQYYGAKEMNPRPPAGWWAEMYPVVAAQYPGASKERLSRIVGGIWWSYPESTRKRLLKEYD